jgi:hypothetical protein
LDKLTVGRISSLISRRHFNWASHTVRHKAQQGLSIKPKESPFVFFSKTEAVFETKQGASVAKQSPKDTLQVKGGARRFKWDFLQRRIKPQGVCRPTINVFGGPIFHAPALTPFQSTKRAHEIPSRNGKRPSGGEETIGGRGYKPARICKWKLYNEEHKYPPVGERLGVEYGYKIAFAPTVIGKARLGLAIVTYRF